MKKTIYSLLLFLIMLAGLGGCSGPSPCAGISAPNLTCLSSFEEGVLFETTGQSGGNKFKVLVLNGTWQEMGRQYGYLVLDELNEFYDLVVTDHLMSTQGLAYAEILESAQQLYDQRYDYQKELVAGLAQVPTLSLEKAMIISSLIDLVEPEAGCSSMAAWGEYTADRPLVVGRNWDLAPPFGEFKKYMSVVVYNPQDSVTSLADINFLGTISLQTGINSHGIFLDVQNGSHSDPTPPIEDRRYPTYVLGDVLLNSQNIEELDAQMMSEANLPKLAAIINVAEPSEDRVYEWATYDVKKRTANELIASTNHFIDPDWTNLEPVPAGLAGDYSLERLANLLALGEEYKGSIDATVMQQIFDTVFDAGGPTFPEYTVYQVVARPAGKTIWLKTPGLSGWEIVELESLFAASP